MAQVKQSNFRKLKLGLVLLTLIFATFIYVGLDDKYTLHNIRDDDKYMTRSDKILIGPTIIDLNYKGNYIIGLRMPVRKLVCKNSRGLVSIRNRIVKKQEFFIVNKSLNNVMFFSEKEVFEAMLSKLDIAPTLDFNKFESVWSRFNGFYKNDDLTNHECEEYWLRSDGYLGRNTDINNES